MKSWHVPVLILVIVGMLGGVLPTWKSNKDLRQELNTLSTDLNQRVAELKSLETQGAVARQKQKEIAKRIPVEMNQAEVLRDIRDITQTTGFAFEGIQFRTGKDGESGATELFAQFQARGAADRVASFLIAIERNSPFFGLSSLQVDRNPLDGSATLAVDLYTYSLR